MKSPLSRLSAEARLVLHADSPRAQQAHEGLDADGEVDWELLLNLAASERAFLPLWRSIRDLEWAQEADEAKALKRAAEVWEFKLMHLERLLYKALDTATENGIDVMLLKGAAVTLFVYGEFGRRPMFDVDVLVRPDDARRLWDLARAGEWSWDSERFPMGSYDEAHHLPTLFDAFGSGVGLEIHSAVWLGDHPFTLGSADYWREAVAIDVAGRRVLVPSVEHQLLHCCTHFAWSHAMRTHSWRTFRDVAAFVDCGRVDWDGFSQMATSSRAASCAYWTLRLARSANAVDVPPDVLARLRPSMPDLLLDRLEQHYIRNLVVPSGADRPCPSLALEKRLWRLGIGLGPPSEGIHLPEADSYAAKGRVNRVMHHLRRVRTWGRYLRDFV